MTDKYNQIVQVGDFIVYTVHHYLVIAVLREIQEDASGTIKTREINKTKNTRWDATLNRVVTDGPFIYLTANSYFRHTSKMLRLTDEQVILFGDKELVDLLFEAKREVLKNHHENINKQARRDAKKKNDT